MFVFIGRGRGLDFCAGPYSTHLPLSHVPYTFGIEKFSETTTSQLITYTYAVLNRL